MFREIQKYQHSKIQNVYHAIKNYQGKKAGKYNPCGGENSVNQN